MLPWEKVSNLKLIAAPEGSVPSKILRMVNEGFVSSPAWLDTQELRIMGGLGGLSCPHCGWLLVHTKILLRFTTYWNLKAYGSGIRKQARLAKSNAVHVFLCLLASMSNKKTNTSRKMPLPGQQI